MKSISKWITCKISDTVGPIEETLAACLFQYY